MSYTRQQSGFTMIELLIGITLGLVVLGGILSVYVPSIQTWRAAAATSTLQDVEQISHELLSRSIRQSGLLVCGENHNLENAVTDPLTASVSKWAFQFTQPFKALAATDTASISSFIESSGQINTVRLGTDGNALGSTDASNAVGDMFYALVPGGESMRITTNVNSGSQYMELTGTSNIEEGELFLVHDCEFPIVIRSIAGSGGNTIKYSSSLHTSRNFPAQTVVSRFNPTVFYLRALNGTPTLYQRELAKTLSGSNITYFDRPVLSGVENLRIEYGVDLPAANAGATRPSFTTNYYTISQMETQKASLPNIYNYAMVVRLSLMIRSDQPNSNNMQQQLKFPALDGANPDCFAAGTHPADACPAFLSTARDRIHKVARYSFSISRTHPISH